MNKPYTQVHPVAVAVAKRNTPICHHGGTTTHSPMAARPPAPLRPVWQALADRRHEVQLAIERLDRHQGWAPGHYHLQQAALDALLLLAPLRRY
jgi:hypothetical protein